VQCVVVLKPGLKADVADFKRHCRELIPAYKSPRSYDIRHEDLPVSAAGKVNKPWAK
jgi:acyl-CoA synthetase (AMP-forming)/AMP-acid ligase II